MHAHTYKYVCGVGIRQKMFSLVSSVRNASMNVSKERESLIFYSPTTILTLSWSRLTCKKWRMPVKVWVWQVLKYNYHNQLKPSGSPKQEVLICSSVSTLVFFGAVSSSTLALLHLSEVHLLHFAEWMALMSKENGSNLFLGVCFLSVGLTLWHFFITRI